MDSPKNSKFEFLNSRIGDLNDHLDEIVDQTSKKFGIIKENVKTFYLQIIDHFNHKANRRGESKSRKLTRKQKSLY